MLQKMNTVSFVFEGRSSVNQASIGTVQLKVEDLGHLFHSTLLSLYLENGGREYQLTDLAIFWEPSVAEDNPARSP